MIGIIGYQTGNSQSVSYALSHLGVQHRVVEDPADSGDVDRYILPGVGSASVTMSSLTDIGWVDHLTEVVYRGGAPFLGICVGLQVLFDHSDEGDGDCLGWIQGEVRRFDRNAIRVPHMGWNTVLLQSHHPISSGLVDGGYYYFVNSYYAVPAQDGDAVGWTTYGPRFASVVARRNIMATQFHTEKSGSIGLEVLRRFASIEKDELVA